MCFTQFLSWIIVITSSDPIQVYLTRSASWEVYKEWCHLSLYRRTVAFTSYSKLLVLHLNRVTDFFKRILSVTWNIRIERLTSSYKSSSLPTDYYHHLLAHYMTLWSNTARIVFQAILQSCKQCVCLHYSNCLFLLWKNPTLSIYS